ncbi:cytosolic sulfotransferase 5-like isoform X1 [Olea europaea var. sylvestris]|uniref:Sulfotransferase n=1 Tax=Olea europaea subsp. europaea TaxID=158383 RepID=A0A8S0RP70_OLEEU|nr:cytosolic sulfotransferase 5-like isoform X1 [Olea europaea var. sylvestris]CAA2981204.1 cytosolic sulfotransferase 5-like [Olea europaea subsp. europaea]CAA2981205.1 cytosolic sulfotransferase 5-like [Olea europaea subsp. europaea]
MEAFAYQNPHPDSAIQKQKWFSDEFLYKFKGSWIWSTYLESTKKVVENFKPLPTDVILASFPKTGTTWLKALLHSIIFRSSEEKSLIFNHPHELIPSLETKLFLESNGKDPEFTDQKVRILGTHIPYQIIGDVLNSSDCKIVYVTRNPKDTLVSLWHFIQKAKKFHEDPWTLEAAVDQFCNGVLPFGPYYDHVLAYREESLKRPWKVFFVTFEELKEDGNKQVKRLAGFLGCPFEGENAEEKIEEIVKSCGFETLSNHEVNKSSETPECFPLPYNSFFRNGKVGDHINYLKPEMIHQIDAITRQKFHASGFVYGI